MMMAQQDSDALRKITDKHKQSRQYIHSETEKQWRLLAELRISHTRLMAWLTRNKQPKVDTSTPPVALRQLTAEQDELSKIDTILHPITPLPLPIAEYHTARPAKLQPITGDFQEVKNTQDKQPNKPTIAYQDELSAIQSDQQKLVKRCQDAITQHYQEQFSQLHPDQPFFKDPHCMPGSIKISPWNWVTLSPLLKQDLEDPRKQYFPGTRVCVVGNRDLNDQQIICE